MHGTHILVAGEDLADLLDAITALVEHDDFGIAGDALQQAVVITHGGVDKNDFFGCALIGGYEMIEQAGEIIGVVALGGAIGKIGATCRLCDVDNIDCRDQAGRVEQVARFQRQHVRRWSRRLNRRIATGFFLLVFIHDTAPSLRKKIHWQESVP